MAETNTNETGGRCRKGRASPALEEDDPVAEGQHTEPG